MENTKASLKATILKSLDIKTSLAILVGVIAPFFYFVGWQYSNAFYFGFGSSYTKGSRSFPEYIALGVQKFFEAFLVGFAWLKGFVLSYGWWLLLGLVIFTMVQLLLLNTFEDKDGKGAWKNLRKWLGKAFNNKWLHYTIIPVLTSGVMTTALAAILFIGLFLASVFFFGYQFGTYSVKEAKANYQPCVESMPNSNQNCTFLYKDKKLILAGLFVGQSDSHISIYNGKTETIELEGIRIVHQFKSE
ncbi:hypothetical protein [Kangiella sp. HZ709]|uniref:hypothetical protein n=1 Tax=Kangiella sp. HZ709 TaxID=2666328 RepID=UPI0012AEFF7C|nr:hypothetical protein [Kangiella sp. HZ709]MRX26589.1 hypothetical protein [Kangiella sp. HZ709]